MNDGFGREISYLRLSVTERCNLRCVYCMPDQAGPAECCDKNLTADEIEEIVRAAAACGIRKVRVTGGEPLVRPGIVDICRMIAAIPEIEELCLTTNGVLLPRYAADLWAAGVRRLNISLDTLNEDKYRAVTRGGSLRTVLDGLQAAQAAGFSWIKINVVLMDGINDAEIRELIELTRQDEIHVRFIELMPVGACADWSRQRFVSTARVLEVMPGLLETGSGGVARLYSLPGCRGTVGLISPVSSHFCPTCNRIRITADGKLKPCLHSAREIDLRRLHGENLIGTIRSAIAGKPRQHHLTDENYSASLRNMNAIGG